MCKKTCLWLITLATSLASIHEEGHCFFKSFITGGLRLVPLEIFHSYTESLADIIGIDVSTFIQSYLEG